MHDACGGLLASWEHPQLEEEMHDAGPQENRGDAGPQENRGDTGSTIGAEDETKSLLPRR